MVGVEVTGHRSGHPAGRMGGVFRGLEYGGVSRSQGADQGMQAELQGIVPGAQNQNAAEGFGMDGGPTR